MSKKSKNKKRVRALALCVFRRGDMIFVARGHDPQKDSTFFRPIGGRIEFGELGRDAVVREVEEELGAALENVSYLGTLENIFTYDGARGHEIVLIYDGRFADPALNQDDVLLTGRDDGEVLYEGSWKTLDFFRGAGAPPLYPAGLLDLLNDDE